MPRPQRRLTYRYNPSTRGQNPYARRSYSYQSRYKAPTNYSSWEDRMRKKASTARSSRYAQRGPEWMRNMYGGADRSRWEAQESSGGTRKWMKKSAATRTAKQKGRDRTGIGGTGTGTALSAERLKAIGDRYFNPNYVYDWFQYNPYVAQGPPPPEGYNFAAEVAARELPETGGGYEGGGGYSPYYRRYGGGGGGGGGSNYARVTPMYGEQQGGFVGQANQQPNYQYGGGQYRQRANWLQQLTRFRIG